MVHGTAARNEVQATLEGATGERRTFSCEPERETVCSLKVGAGGSYSLEVTAPGFRSVSVPASISYAVDPTCGCPGATIDPARVTLEPT
jgi:hypothetical protein